MGFGNKKPGTVKYYENYYDATSTNSGCDVRVEDPNDLINDLDNIGFKNITYQIRNS
jgi:hypothetical protein